MQERSEWATNAVGQEDMSKGLFYYQLMSSNCNEADDSLLFWWKSMCNQGQIRMKFYRWEDARNDFEAVLDFVQNHKSDTAEYIARRNLGRIAFRKREYTRADTLLKQACRLAADRKFGEEMTKGLEEEALLAASACLSERGNLPEKERQALLRLANGADLHTKVAALAVLMQDETRDGGFRYVLPYMALRDSLGDMEFEDYRQCMERENALLTVEVDKEIARQRSVLFAVYVVFVLFLCGGIYAIFIYRRKHEQDAIRLILLQKENEIIRLQQCSRASEEQYKKELENMRNGDERFRRANLYGMKIGKLLPLPDNPNQPRLEEYEKLLVKEADRKRFITEINHCFSHFADGLQQLVPDLTDEDLMYCCLFRLGVRKADIAAMVCLTRNAVSMRQLRIERKMGEKWTDVMPAQEHPNDKKEGLLRE